MGRKCSIEECLAETNRSSTVGVTFHKVPLHTDIRPKWLSLCHIPEDNLKVIYICSRHFLSADFCNFKGKKYILKQGVLPSVFPWSRSNKMERVQSKSKSEIVDAKSEATVDVTNAVAKHNFLESVENNEKKVMIKPDNSYNKKEEVLSPGHSTTIEQKTKVIDSSTGPITFAPNTRIEALDFNQTWSPAQIVEVDYEENEVLVHFEKYPNKYDEWISMNSNTLRALKMETKLIQTLYNVGEKCMAVKNDNTKRYTAWVRKIIDNDTYEVQFDDGSVKVLNGSKLYKLQIKMQSAPLFDPVTDTKQERREKKRKLNVAALFGKKPRSSNSNTPVNKDEDTKNVAMTDNNLSAPTEEAETQKATAIKQPFRWENGKPIGTKASLDTMDGPRKSVIVDSTDIPPKWTKHLIQRISGMSAGKWDSVIVSPEGRKFRTRAELKNYLDDHPQLNLTESMFDFSLHRGVRKRKTATITSPPAESSSARSAPEQSPANNEPEATEEDEIGLSLKIPVVDDVFKCPIVGCGKTFRRENLAQMHVKHYHPKYKKYLNSTPKVADLAYARTVGESLDRSPGPEKSRSTTKQQAKTSTPKAGASKLPQSPAVPATDNETKETQPKIKDSEIIKLLNSKPSADAAKKEENHPSETPSVSRPSTPPHTYPDIKLKDLLMISEGIPKGSDGTTKQITTSRPGGAGIKTLLPVVRLTELKDEDRWRLTKRKREPSETIDVKPSTTTTTQPKESSPSPATITKEPEPPSNIIIEGGEVIKIVQMKMEEIINCTCGITEEDGLMIQCELCLCWQHAYCNNIERENQVPEKYICYICQNPMRQRSSRKYVHDQDWLKNGVLPTASYHCKDEEVLAKRFEKLKKSHDLSGGLLELKQYLHTMRMKINIAESKNHPKLYLWSKQWDKLPLSDKQDALSPQKIKTEDDETSMLMSLLKNNDEIKVKDEPPTDSQQANVNCMGLRVPNAPIVPQPEAPIKTADCKFNLLKHISHSQSLIEERLNELEKQIDALDASDGANNNEEENIKQTTQMILRDLNTFKEFSLSPTI